MQEDRFFLFELAQLVLIPDRDVQAQLGTQQVFLVSKDRAMFQAQICLMEKFLVFCVLNFHERGKKIGSTEDRKVNNYLY